MNNTSKNSPNGSGGISPLFLAGVMGVAVVGYFVGIHAGVPQPDARPDQARPVADGHDVATPAKNYSEMRRSSPAMKEPLLNVSLNRVPQPAFDRLAEVLLDPQAKLRSIAERTSRRAFNGAPPVIPHAVEGTSDAACYACHGKGIVIGDRVAHPMSHAFLANCLQCHAPPSPPPFVEGFAKAFPNDFVGAPSPTAGKRAFTGAPSYDSPYHLDAKRVPCVPWWCNRLEGIRVDSSLANLLHAVPRPFGSARSSGLLQG